MEANDRLRNKVREILKGVKGIENAYAIHPGDLGKILSLEEEAEKRSLMGLGKVVNSGVREVLEFDAVYVALTSMEFEWGRYPTLILKKGDQLVGEEIYDEAVIAELSKDANAWFMHKNFVIYKNLVSFPQDIMQKMGHFLIS